LEVEVAEDDQPGADAVQQSNLSLHRAQGNIAGSGDGLMEIAMAPYGASSATAYQGGQPVGIEEKQGQQQQHPQLKQNSLQQWKCIQGLLQQGIGC